MLEALFSYEGKTLWDMAMGEPWVLYILIWMGVTSIVAILVYYWMARDITTDHSYWWDRSKNS